MESYSMQSFCIRPLSFSIAQRDVSEIHPCFLFIAVLFHYRNVLFLYSVDGHLGCFYLYDIMSSAALIILVHTFGTYVCISAGYVCRHGTAGFSFSRYCQQFSKWLYQFTLQAVVYESSGFSVHSPTPDYFLYFSRSVN